MPSIGRILQGLGGALDATGGVNELSVAGEEELRRLRDEILGVFNDPNRSALLSPQSRIVLADTLAELEQKLSSLLLFPEGGNS